MAQSNATKNTSKGSKKAKSSSSNGKIGLSTFTIILLVLLGGIVFYLFDDDSDMGLDPAVETVADRVSEEDTPSDTWYNSSDTSASEDIDLWTIDYEQEALPRLKRKVSSMLIRHKAYSTSYNTDYKIPNWTFYELTEDETYGDLPRSNEFQPDPSIPNSQASQLEDYRGSGLDRGHMAPSMDFNWDADIENETYYLSNMCPQDHDFNSGIWLDLEHQVGRWARRDSAICVACGPILPKKEKGRQINPVTGQEYHITTIGRGKVLVPEHFFKVILSPFGDYPKAIGFIMPNENVLRRDGRGNAPIKDFAVSVDRVEELTGIDFFSILPDDIEDRIEKRYENDDWFRNKRNYNK